MTDWRDQAACLGTDLAVFFSTTAGGVRFGDEAKRICACCPVREACLEWALERPSEFGVWGGLTEAERRKLRARRRAAT